MALPKAPEFTLAILLLALPQFVWAAGDRQTYCCVDDHGHQSCGDVLPPQCYNKAYRILGAKGVTAKVVDAPLTPEQRAQREADEQRRKADERMEKEQRRRDMALLETYASEKEIDETLQRAVRQHEVGIKEVLARQTALQTRQKTLAAEAEFYARKPMPLELRNAIKDNEVDLKSADEQIQARRKDIESTRIRFEEEKRRFMDLKRRGASVPPSTAVKR